MHERTYVSARATAAMSMVLAVLFSVSGCMSMAPTYTQPPLPVAAHFDGDDGRDGLSAAATGWQAYFTDARLQAPILV